MQTGQTIRFIAEDGESVSIDHPWGRGRRAAIAAQDAQRKADKANRERKYQSDEDAQGISGVLSMKTTD